MNQTGHSPEGLFSQQPGFDDPTHLAWLDGHRAWFLDFYQRHGVDPAGGFAWVSDDGQPMPQMGHPLFVGARMIHVFALAELAGRDGAGDVVEHGLNFYLDGDGWDAEHGGWFATVGGEDPSEAKELYGHAQMLLAATSVMVAGHDRGRELMDRAMEVINTRFWQEDLGLCLESFDRPSA